MLALFLYSLLFNRSDKPASAIHTMAKKKKKATLRPGLGAEGTILTRFIRPKQSNDDPKHRSEVLIIGKEELTFNKKNQECFTFSLVGGPPALVCHAVTRYIKLVKEGGQSKCSITGYVPGPNN